MFTAIISAIVAIFQAIPVIGSWFKKSEIEKETDAQNSVKDEINKIQDTGRP